MINLYKTCFKTHFNASMRYKNTWYQEKIGGDFKMKNRNIYDKEYSLQSKLHPKSVTDTVRTASGITLIALVVTKLVPTA